MLASSQRTGSPTKLTLVFHMQRLNRTAGVTSFLVAFLLVAAPLAAQQKRPPAPRKPPVVQPPEPVPTFDTLLTDESYKVYSEVRNVGALVHSQAFNDLLEPVIKLAAPPKEFKSVVKWLKAHAEALADSRMFVASWPSRTTLPSILIAIDFASADEAKKFEAELRGFLPTLLPKPSPSPAVSPSVSPAVQSQESLRVSPSTPTQKENTAVLPTFQIKQTGSLVLLSEQPVSLRDLKPRGSKLLAEDPNFALARNRFASESLFLYLDLKSIEKEEQEQRRKWEEEERRRREREAANPPKEEPEAEIAPETMPNPAFEEHAPVPSAVPSDSPQARLRVTDSNGQEVGTATLSGSSRSSGSEEIGWDMIPIYGALFGGPPTWPEAIGAAVAFDDDGYMVRALIVNSPENKSIAIPFMPKVISGPALTPSSPGILPADTNLFVSVSLDYPQIYEGILKAFASAVEASANYRKQSVDATQRLSPFAAYEKKLGLKIKDDLLPLLGNEIAFALPKPRPKDDPPDSAKPSDGSPPSKSEGPEGPKPAGTPDLSPVIAISLKDKEAFRRLLPKIIESLGFKGADLFAQTEKRDETEIVTYANAFSYAFVGDFFVFSPQPALTRHVVDSYLSHQTLSSDSSFRHATRWQPRQVQGQAYVAPSLIDLYYPLGTSTGSHDNDKMREVLSRVNPMIEPMTYALSNEGLGPLHEVHIPKNLLLLAIAGISSQASQSPLTTNESIAKSILRTVVAAEATFHATKGNGRYGSLDELVAEGLLSKDLTERYGYRIELAVLSNKFEATAVPLEYGKTGKMSFFVDESGVLRGGDHGGGAATISDNPVE